MLRSGFAARGFDPDKAVAELLGAIGSREVMRLDEFNPQDLANTALAFVKMEVRDVTCRCWRRW